MEWIKFSLSKDDNLHFEVGYLALTSAANAHLYMRDGYTWAVYQNYTPKNPVVEYLLKSNHTSFMQMIKNKVVKYTVLMDEPEMDSFKLLYGGSQGFPYERS